MAERYFVSDLHFGHNNIIEWERFRFKTIHEHDSYIIEQHRNMFAKMTEEDTYYNLGDWGNTDYLWLLDECPAKKVFVYGNHDKVADMPKFQQVFDEVYRYPVMIDKRTLISHFPQRVWDDQINIHGHLHMAYLDDPHYVCVSYAVRDYLPYKGKSLAKQLTKVDDFSRKFCQEPWAGMHVFTGPKEDVVMDEHGKIMLPETLEMRQGRTSKEIFEMNKRLKNEQR